MKLKQIKNELWAIGKSYPSIAGMLVKQYPNGGTVGDHWAKLMLGLDDTHLENVCTEYASFERPLPAQFDALAFDIVSEVKERTWRDEERLRVHELRLAARKVKPSGAILDTLTTEEKNNGR